MGILFTLFLNNIAPLFLIALIGWILAKKFSIDIYTLTKINIYIFVPALVFVKIAETEITRDLLKSFFFTLVLMFIMNLIVGGVSRLRKSTPSVARAMKNGVLFYNSGNMGLPLIMLIFNELPQAVSVQIMVMLAQNLTTNTLGLYNANRGNMDVKGSLLQVIKTPSIYAVATGFFFWVHSSIYAYLFTVYNQFTVSSFYITFELTMNRVIAKHICHVFKIDKRIINSYYLYVRVVQ